jgi:signal transduction histidine kinase
MMPEMDGVTVLTHLKGDPRTRDLPVVMLSAHTEKERIRQCIDLGADDYLTKPIDMEALIARLGSCVRRKMLQDQEREYRRRLEMTNVELRRLNLQKSHFLAVAAHDLKSPLTAVRLLAEQLTDSEAQQDMAALKSTGKRIQGAVERILATLQALLDSVASDTGHLKLNKRLVDVGAIVAKAAEDNRIYADSKGIRLVPPPEDRPAYMTQIDELRMAEAVDNLINNAIKFSLSGTEVRITLEHREGDPPQVVLKVRDQGPGLTEDDKTKVFGAYQRLSAQPTGNETSTGLGLSIVKQMVELHGGNVWVESEVGLGATFALEIPLVEPVRSLD